MLEGADGITWVDANLTELGEGQAKDVHELWKEQLPKGIPAPESYYVSPMRRAIQTADITFKELDLPSDRPYAPIGKEVWALRVDAFRTSRQTGTRADYRYSSSAKPSACIHAIDGPQPRSSSPIFLMSSSNRVFPKRTSSGKRTTVSLGLHANTD